MNLFALKKSSLRIQSPVTALTIGLLISAQSIANPADTEATIRDLVGQAKTAMANGNPQQAAELYEKAAGYGESADAEIGLVRAYLQAGEFRKTIAFANLVAAEHPDVNDTAALLAYLEDREGQTPTALAKLDEAIKNHPDDAALMGAYAEILIDRMAITKAVQKLDAWIASNPPHGDIYRLRAKAALVSGHHQDVVNWRKKSAEAYEANGRPESAKPLRAWLANLPNTTATINLTAHSKNPAKRISQWPAPNFADFPVSTGQIKSGNGFVIDEGRYVLTYASLVAHAKQDLWVRNGLGVIRLAHIEKIIPDQGVALLRLSTPYPKTWSLPKPSLAIPKKLKFCFVMGYPVTDALETSYPLIAPSVVVRPKLEVGNLMQLSSSLGNESSGNAVFDPSGQLIGMTLGNQEPLKGMNNRDSVLGKGVFAVRADALGEALPKGAKNHRQHNKTKVGHLPVEELYEKLQPALVTIVASE